MRQWRTLGNLTIVDCLDKAVVNIYDDKSNHHRLSPGLHDMSTAQVLSVSQLTRCIRGVIEAEDLFRDVLVQGEISNLTKHASGHIYFCLKDESALIRCVMWKGNARSVRFELAEGMNVIARGQVSVYEKQGQYQLIANEITPAGIGTLYIAYEQLKARLRDEGLFDETRKKAIPLYPKRIAIITSSTAAALRDMVTIARRRMPSVDILLVPALMQGEGSEASVVESLALADTIPDIDVIILGRGGGSIEDLWSFNSEAVVRAIYACRTPVVSAIGHETDYTLSDFAADLRGATPSTAIELVIPDREELAVRLRGIIGGMTASMASVLSRKRGMLDLLASASVFKYPERMLHDRWQLLDSLAERLTSTFGGVVSRYESRLGEVSAKLEGLSPLGVLARGYSIVRRTRDGRVVKRVADVQPGEMTETLISDGRLVSEVTEIKEGRT